MKKTVNIRKILSLREVSKLSSTDKLLYNPYKNIVSNFFKLSTEISANVLDPISYVFNGIENADKEIKSYYKSLLDVTSFFQASKGGRGKFIEKKLASVSENTCLDISLDELPLFLNFTEIIRKKKIFGEKELTNIEKSTLRLSNWDYLINDNETTDLVSKINNKLIFLELKNRVDSGGVSARREVLESKFIKLIDFIQTNKKIFSLNSKNFSLIEFFKLHNFKEIVFALGFLFSTDGTIATVSSDKNLGFFGANKNSFNRLHKEIKKIPNISHLNFNLSNNQICFYLKEIKFIIKIIYGEDITNELYGNSVSLLNLIQNKYDDLWLFQIITIEERKNLYEYKNNCILIIIQEYKKNYQFRQLIDEFINSNGNNIDILYEIIHRLENLVDTKLIPPNRDKNAYLSDLIYFFSSNI